MDWVVIAGYVGVFVSASILRIPFWWYMVGVVLFMYAIGDIKIKWE